MNFAENPIYSKKLRNGSKNFAKVLGTVARFVMLVGLCIILLYPILIMISISLRRPAELFDPTVVWIPKTFTLENYIYSLKKINFLEYFLTTGGVALVSSFLQMCTCCLAGYGLARFKFKGHTILFILMLVSIIVPPQIVIIPSYLNFVKFDFFGLGELIGLFTEKTATVSLYNNVLSFFLPALFGNGIKGGLFLFIFFTFFKGMTNELAEAGYIDGCNRFTAFLYIMLPNAKASIITVMLFSVVWYWNDYYYTNMYFQDLPMVSYLLDNLEGLLQIGSGSEITNPYARFCIVIAAALLTVLPVLILYIIFQRYFTESIENTGLVG